MSQTEPKKTHWKRLVNPKYLGAYSLDPGKDKTVTIDRVERDIITTDGGKKEECSICYMKGDKPLILNATNNKSIAKLYGPFIEDWAGKQVTLFTSTTRMGGETVECLRIRPEVTPLTKEKQPITDERFSAALKAIGAGTYTSARLENDFVLTDPQRIDLDKYMDVLTGAKPDQSEPDQPNE